METLKPKLFSTMKTYTKEQFIKDLVSGIIVAIIALPLSIALALASGVNPEQGIYTAIVAGFLISFLGGSRVQIAGPTAAFATIVAGIVAKNGMEGLIAATIVAGIFLILMGILRLGSLIRFIPYTITTGFTAGIAVTIIIGQVKDFLGLTFTTSPIETMDKVKAIGMSITTINFMALVIGLLALVIQIVWPKIKGLNKIPGSLIAVVVTAALVKCLDLNVNTIGDLYDISSKIPTPALPKMSLKIFRDVVPDAFTIAILAAIESLLSCVVADGMVGDRHNSNMELIAQGVGNIGSAVFGGIPATGAIARTAANIKNGGRTPIAGMIHAICLLLILVLLMPYAALIPMPCIAAILFIVAYNMSSWRSCVSLVKLSPKSDILVFAVTFVLTVVFDLVIAIAAGLLLAVILFVKRMADVTEVSGWTYIDENEDVDRIGLKAVPKDTLVYEISGPMFFGAADQFMKVAFDNSKKVVILRMRSVPAMDISALNTLRKLNEQCKRADVKLIFSHVNEQPYKMMKKACFVEEIGEENFCKNIDDALLRAVEISKKN
ncbi:MAG: SulP family inorganic anion transporter [Lachnospiraceae bacterium]|nr:SulP family inorganic anion transporter [Lachnospiraceae bacterium]